MCGLCADALSANDCLRCALGCPEPDGDGLCSDCVDELVIDDSGHDNRVVDYTKGVVVDIEMTGRVNQALDLIDRYGGTDGAHHKQWVLDQVVRALAGDGYATWVADHCSGEDGYNTYDWDTGVAP